MKTPRSLAPGGFHLMERPRDWPWRIRQFYSFVHTTTAPQLLWRSTYCGGIPANEL